MVCTMAAVVSMHACIHTSFRGDSTYIHMYIHDVYTHFLVESIHACIYTYLYTHPLWSLYMHTYIHTCIHTFFGEVNTHTYMHTCIRIYMHMHIFNCHRSDKLIHSFFYTFMYVCMYVCVLFLLNFAFL
jgi:hypothetical protein